MTTDGNVILKVEHLTKLFGSKKSAAREMMKSGASKEEIFKQTGVTVAVDDISFDVERGKIFALIGLSRQRKIHSGPVPQYAASADFRKDLFRRQGH